jgi:hypothetical protein
MGWSNTSVRFNRSARRLRLVPAQSRSPRQAGQTWSNPYQLTEPPEQREGDPGDVAETKGFQQKQIPAVLHPETAGDEEGAAFDKDGEGEEGHGRHPQIPDDDIHFHRFRDPTKEEQPGGGIKGREENGGRNYFRSCHASPPRFLPPPFKEKIFHHAIADSDRQWEYKCSFKARLFLSLGMAPVLIPLRLSNEDTDDPSKIAYPLFRDGG